MSSTGEKIKLIRLKKCMTLEIFGEQLTPVADKGTVSSWERNRHLPNAERLGQIAKLGDMSIEELLGKEDSTCTRCFFTEVKEGFNYCPICGEKTKEEGK